MAELKVVVSVKDLKYLYCIKDMSLIQVLIAWYRTRGTDDKVTAPRLKT